MPTEPNSVTIECFDSHGDLAALVRVETLVKDDEPTDTGDMPPPLVGELFETGDQVKNRSRLPVEIYGWSLLYQLPHMSGRAVIDSHDSFCELPAFFESPLELVDRSAFLTARGIPHRPLALLTQPEDFVPAQTGPGIRNLFASDASLHRTCPLHNLWPG